MRVFRRFLPTWVLVLMILALSMSAQTTEYTNASLNGSYSFLTNLWTADETTNQSAMVGVLTFNGEGSVTGSYTQASDGVIGTGMLGGTYAVTSNGTGTIAFTTGSTAEFAITLNSIKSGVAAGVQLLQTNDSTNEIVSGTAVLQSKTAETYSVASLSGSFSFLWNLWTASGSQYQSSQIGTLTFDGKGGSKSSQTSVSDGLSFSNSGTGTYSVNADGSGSLSGSGGTQFFFVLNSVAAGKAGGAQFINPSCCSFPAGNYVISGTALKQ